jgi:EthD domain
VIKFLAGGPGDPVPLWEQGAADDASRREIAFASDTRHATVARHMLGLRRYSVSRATARQPGIADPARVPVRIAELWWDTVRDIEVCFNSPSGLADLADAIVRFPDTPVSIPARMSGPNLCFTAETDFPVAHPAAFGFHDGLFRGVPVPTKLYGFVRTDDLAGFDDWYVTTAAALAHDLPGVRCHVLDRRVPETIRIGNLVRGDQHSGDRVVNLWFDDVEAIDAALATPAGRELVAGVTGRAAGGVDWLAMRNQEIFFSRELDRRTYGLDD